MECFLASHSRKSSRHRRILDDDDDARPGRIAPTLMDPVPIFLVHQAPRSSSSSPPRFDAVLPGCTWKRSKVQSRKVDWAALNYFDAAPCAAASSRAAAHKGPPLPLPAPTPDDDVGEDDDDDERQLRVPSSAQAAKDRRPERSQHSVLLCELGYQELDAACKSFSPDCCVGHGDRGPMYKCRIRFLDWRGPSSNGNERVEALVMKLAPCLSSEALTKEWIAEVNALAGLQHPHLSGLLGYCTSISKGPPGGRSSMRKRFLVYERPCKGTLDKFLYGRRDRPVLDWSRRMKVLLTAARGLEFLHARSESSSSSRSAHQYYRELRTFNIGISRDSSARLVGYSLWTRNHNMGAMIGPYAAPETACQGQLSCKSNVWSFGIIMLEVLTGRQNLEGIPKDVVHLSSRLLEDDEKIVLLLDPELKGMIPLANARRVAGLARRCVQMDPRLRPSMKEVVEVLETVQVPHHHKMKSLREILDESSLAAAAVQSRCPPRSVQRSSSKNRLLASCLLVESV